MRGGIVRVALAAIIGLGAVVDAAGSAQKGAAPAVPAAKAALPAPVDVVTHLNRTAVWVGDPIVWTVELMCPPTFDVIADDLAADKLQLEGLELVGSTTERTTEPGGGLVHRVVYQFRTYEIGLPALRIAPLTVRYFVRRPGQRAEDLTPAGQVDVPGAQLAWRSTMPAGMKTVDVRGQRAEEPVPPLLRVARAAGFTLVGLSIAPVALWAVGHLRRLRLPRERRPSRRASRREARRALDALLAADTSTEAARREAYAGLNDVLRRFITATSGAPAVALTFEEVSARMGAGADPGREAITDALEECDRACYGVAGTVPSADQFRDSVTLLARVL